MTTAQEIIQEALEVAIHEYPKSILDRLFYREPSESKIKSSAIRYLADRIIKSENDKEEYGKKLYDAVKEATRFIEQRSPEEARIFYQKYMCE